MNIYEPIEAKPRVCYARAIVSMVLGISSLTTTWIGGVMGHLFLVLANQIYGEMGLKLARIYPSVSFYGILGIIYGIVGIVQSNKFRRLYATDNSRMTKAGLVTSIIGIASGTLLILFRLICIKITMGRL